MRTIFSVGMPIPGNPCEEVAFLSRQSLLDADIVLFRPIVSETATTFYQGKPSLSEFASFRLKSAASHWKRELALSVEAGKTVIVFLDEPREVYVDTGKRQYSGIWAESPGHADCGGVQFV